MPTTDRIPSIADIRAAAARLEGVAVRTPLLECEALNARAGARLLLKCETFQPVRAFKIRGAWNCISQLSDAERARGVTTFSSGNHAQAVAAAAHRLGIHATIVMPSDAPRIKIDRTEAYGATVVLRDRKEREAAAAEIAARSGAVPVPPYDHADVIAGQGTVGLEIVEQCEEIGVVPNMVIVPCSGGGLVAGCAIALRDRWPDVEIYAAEPEEFDDTRQSLASGVRTANPSGGASICDALLVSTPGEMTFEINRALLAGAVAVSDVEVKAAMRAALLDACVVTEPGGAAGLAAALHGKTDVAGRTVCVVLSGGNVDPALLSELVAAS